MKSLFGKSNMKRVISGFVALTSVAVLTTASAASAITSTVTVTESNKQTWVFNPDLANATPYNFTGDKASLGEGSLYVQPLPAEGARKFIATKPLNVPVQNYVGTSYDFQIAGDETVADAEQYYLNVYTNLPGSNTFYDCRYDYTPTTGSTTEFTTASFSATSTPAAVGDRSGDNFTCPATLDDMPDDSIVKAVALNLGDTSTNDEGLAGYFDAVVISTVGDVRIYDFEATLTNKEQCKNNGWKSTEAGNFKNQGQCVSKFASNKQ